MKKVYTIALIVLLGISKTNAQNFHLTMFAGASNYSGELQPNFFTLKQATPAFGLGGLYELNERVYLRGNLTYGKLKANDSKYARNATRNLSFSSPITELNLGVEYDILNSYERLFTPYVFSGISIFHMNPSTVDSTGGVVYLQSLGTEGQGFVPGKSKYKLNQVALPFGAGVKYSVSENMKIRFELGFRKTFTDYLDDVSSIYADQSSLLTNNGSLAVSISYRGDEVSGVSKTYPGPNRQRGNPDTKDWYYFVGFGVSFRLSSDNY